MTYLFALVTAWLAALHREVNSEFDVFTKTVLVFAIMLAIASVVARYSDESGTHALAACETVKEALPVCMEARGYVPIEGDSVAPDGWQREWIARLFSDW